MTAIVLILLYIDNHCFFLRDLEQLTFRKVLQMEALNRFNIANTFFIDLDQEMDKSGSN